MALGPLIVVALVALICLQISLVNALLFYVEKNHRQT